MTASLAPVTLEGSRVRLEPLGLDHAPDLAAAAAADRSTFGLTWVPDGLDADHPSPRQTAVYSVISDEWPRVRAHLHTKMGTA